MCFMNKTTKLLVYQFELKSKCFCKKPKTVKVPELNIHASWIFPQGQERLVCDIVTHLLCGCQTSEAGYFQKILCVYNAVQKCLGFYLTDTYFMSLTLNVYLVRICSELVLILLCFFFLYLYYTFASLHIPHIIKLKRLTEQLN